MVNPLAICNPRPRKLPGPQLLHHLVPAQGTRGAAAIEHAAHDGSTTCLGYDELHQRADALAARIIEAQQHLKCSSRRLIIPILLPQCPDLYIAQLAILKAGAAFCPIVLDVPDDRLRFILQDVDARVLLTTASFQHQLPPLDDVAVIAVDGADSGVSNDAPFTFPSVSPRDPAYIMYTSGSTGKPKGVVLSHFAVTQALLAHDLHIPAFSRFLQFASPTFDVSVFEIFFPWLRRATLVSCDRRRLLNDLPAVIDRLDIDACELTPSIASTLLRGRKSVPSLKLLLTIGEMLKPAVVQAFGGDSEEPGILHGMYGPTEATIHCTLQTYFSKDMSCGNIGVPLDTVSTFVVNAVDDGTVQSPSLEILRIGEEGELAVGGYQLADGYLNREEQTRLSFVSHPEFGMLYRTGDRAKMLANGTLQCLGRMSSGQVKLRGQRIELGEIEHAATRTPGCRDVVAEVISSTLVVFAVVASGHAVKREIIDTCKAWLPSFMVPGDVVILDQIPYLASGKCDRKTLRQQYEQQQQSSIALDLEEGAEMQKVCRVVSRVLDVDVHSSSLLPGLGLDSISAIRVASELYKAGFAQLEVGRVLSARTPKQIMSALDVERNSHSQSREPYRQALDFAIANTIPQELLPEIETTFPCTPTQVAMLAETEKLSCMYCNWIELWLPGHLDLDYVEERIRVLAGLHPMLRSGFTSLTEVSWSYANIVWKSLLPEQVVRTTSFDYNFELVSSTEMLRPCSFALMAAEGGSRLLVKLHHASYDQWSMDILQSDLAGLLHSSFRQAPESFKAVADYHLNVVAEDKSSATVDFWQEHLRNVIPTSLPLLRAQAVPDALTRTAWHSISVETGALKARAKEIGCSAPAIFQTAIAYLLGTYAGTTDVILGTVFSGRTFPIPGIAGVLGPCLATLPLRIDFDAASTLEELLRAVTDCNRAMQTHLVVPPTVIRETAGITPGTSLFDTLFVWQQSTLDAMEGSQAVTLVDSEDQLEFHLVLEMDPSHANMQVRATFQQSLIDTEQIEILIRQIDDTVTALLEDSGRAMEDIVASCLSNNLLSMSNPEPLEYAQQCDLISSIQQRAAQDPTALAIVFANSMDNLASNAVCISYSQLDETSNRMAHTMIALGVKPNDIICICMEKCADLYIVMLAILKAGAGYLPLVPDTPPSRVQNVLGRTKVKLCICDSNTAPRLQSLVDATVVNIASFRRTDFSVEPPNTVQSGSRIAYAVFTSGSTGEPKGVAVTMDNLQSNLSALRELYKVAQRGRLLQACSQAFDVSVFEIFFTFFTGMCLCSATRDVMFRDFEHSIRTFEVTHLSLTPTVAALVKPENVPTVRFLVTAGEAVTEKVHRSWAGNGLHQGYGPSETTNICSVKMNTAQDDVLGNIGPPLHNTSAFVVAPQKEFQILPLGAYGEYVLGGEQVFKGYIGREDLSNTKLINHPQYGKLYRSGDMGRILHDGTLLIAGRLDDQVKIRGNRVELGEINTRVSDHPSVTDCTTLVLHEGSPEEFLVTFCVLSSSESADGDYLAVISPGSSPISQIFDRLEVGLPSYMIPNFIITLRRLPMTSQGKLDKRMLRSIFNGLETTARGNFARSYSESAQDPPANPLEQTIVEKLSKMMQISASNIHRHSSFFAVGLNSLNAIQLARLLEKKLQVRVGVATILRNPSPARLSKALAQGACTVEPTLESQLLLPRDFVKATADSLNTEGISFEAILPCTPLQEVMLSASAAEGSLAYCNSTKFTFSGDLQRLKSCWYALVERHGILRTLFLATDNRLYPFVQVVLSDPPQTWHQLPSASSNGHPDEQINGHCKDDEHQPYPALPSVNSKSPVRVDILGKDVHLRMHHAVYDGIAITNLLLELQASFEGTVLPPAVSLEPFLREVAAQNQQEAIRFWSQQIRDFEPRPLPKRDSALAYPEQVVKCTLSASVSEIEAYSERHACTSLAILQAAWAKTLACAQDILDICFGNVVSGRAVPVSDVDRLVAPCFNTVPLRTRLDVLRTNLDLVRQMHKKNLETLPYQLTAGRRIQSLSRKPSIRLFDSILLLQPPQEGKAAWAVEDTTVNMEIPVVLEFVPQDSHYELRLQYMPEKVSGRTANCLVEAFLSSLDSCLRYPANSIAHFQEYDAAYFRGALKSTPQDTAAAGEDLDNLSPSANGDWSLEEGQVRATLAKLASIEPGRITKQTSIYQIGLDSLNAVQVASILRSQGLSVDAADVMQHQTPAAIAAFARARTNKETETFDMAVVDLDAFDLKHRSRIIKTLHANSDDIESVRPCTPAQSGMLAQFIHSDGSLYVGHITYEIPVQYTIEDVADAWRKVQRKHQILRMGFQQIEDALTPFAMLIYRPDTFSNAITATRNDALLSSLPSDVADDILKQLHTPAWRLCLDHKTMQISLHHALYDADSLRILLKDFRSALRLEQLGSTPVIDSLLKEQLESLALHKQESKRFWSTALQSCHLLRFPNLTPTTVSKPQTKSTRFSSATDIEILISFCSQESVTIQALGQAVWAMLLAEYVGESDVTFGTVFSGFSFNSKSAAFPAISTIPVYCDTSKAAAVDVVRDMVSFNASAQRHRFTPLSEIQRHAGGTGQALFDTVFVYQKTLVDEQEFDWHILADTLDVDFVASMELEAPSKGKVGLRLTYDTKCIPDAHASLILQQYDMILSSILNRTPTVHGRHLLSHTPPKEASLPCSVRLLHEFVEHGATLYPQATAFEFIHALDSKQIIRSTWTYHELNERSNQVAHLVLQHNVKPGSIIAVCMAKSAEASFAFNGILKAGCSFLAMDPDLPVARRKFILEDSNCQLLFVDRGRSDPEMDYIIDCIQLEERILESLPTTAVHTSPIESSATSYCLYTSGTTGTPKGCELTHENAVQAMMSFQRLFSGRWTKESRWLQFASYWFDVSVLEQFWSWSVGITVVGAPRDVVLEDLAGFIRKARITHIDLTPSLARLLKPEDAPSLHDHVFITGGEALKQDIINVWGPYKTICNGYGPTEATIGVTMNPFIGSDAKPSNIGLPFDNVGAYVLKSGTDKMVLRGAVGELCVSGKLVGKGYLNRPELTAQCFPFLQRHGERVYRTGDLVRLLADGSVIFIGRADTQTKLRGQRLEIDEIDSVIKNSSTGISDVASLVTKSANNGREMLVSFIVDNEADSRDVELSEHAQSHKLIRGAEGACHNSLPGYMIPTHIIPVTRLPLTVNNKVDSKRLVVFFSSLSNKKLQQLKGEISSNRAMSRAESKIAKVLSRLLSISQTELNPHSNVFSVGLSSITAINFVSQLKRSGFQKVTVATIMKNPTLSHLAEALSSETSNAPDDESATKQAQLSLAAFGHRHRIMIAERFSTDVSDIESLAPCTPLQTGLLTESLKGATRPYFNHFWYDISNLDLDRVQLAVIQLHRQTEMLRITFLQTDEGFAQVIFTGVQCPVKRSRCLMKSLTLHLTTLKSRWSLCNDQEVVMPFEAHIVQSGEQAVLAIHVHHALYDGISWDLTVNLLTRLYKRPSATHTGPSFFHTLPYGPLRARHGEELFWRSYLHGTHFTPLPTLSPSNRICEPSLQVRLADGQVIENIQKQAGVSHQAIFQTAFAIALHQFSPQTDCYGVVLSGRSLSLDSADKVLGPLFNTVPFVANLGQPHTWTQQLYKAQKVHADILPYQHTPLRDVRRACGRFPSDPVFDVLFVFQRSEASQSSKHDILFRPIHVSTPAEYPLAFEVTLNDAGEVNINVVAQSAYANTATLRGLVDKFETALQEMSQNLEQPISDRFHTEALSKAPDHTTKSDQQEAPKINGTRDFEWTAEAITVRRAIAELARCDQETITEYSTIFTLGLDSIDSVKLAAVLKKANLKILVSDILKAQTIPRMLQVMDIQRKITTENDKCTRFAVLEAKLNSLPQMLYPEIQEGVERVLPATPGQEALVADMVRSGLQDYYNSDILRLRSDIDIDRLKSAWYQVVEASPILRTSFIEVTDPVVDVVFAQLIHNSWNRDITETSLSNLKQVDGYLQNVRRDVAMTFALQSPLRLAIFTIDSDRYLVISLSHAQYDGHSLALMHEDLHRAYHGGILARPRTDVAMENALDATSDAARCFWRNELTGANIRLLCDWDNVVHCMTHRAERTSTTSSQLARERCKNFGVTMQALAGASWALVLAYYLQELEVITGVVLACRDSEEAEEVMFPTMNTVPVRTTIHGSSKDFVRHFQSIMNSLRPYQRTPLRFIQSASSGVAHRPSPQGSGALFDTLFTYQHRPPSSVKPSESLYESVDGVSNVNFPVAVELEAVGDQLVLRAAVKDIAFDKAGTDGLLTKFDRVLDFLISSPAKPTIEFSGSRISICTLPTFSLRDGSLSLLSPLQDAIDNAEEGESTPDSPYAALICSALAQVSKLPEQDILPNSTIESIGIDSISAIKVSALLRNDAVKLSVSEILKARTLRRMVEFVEARTESPTPLEVPSLGLITNALQLSDIRSILEENNVNVETVESVMPASAGQQYMLAMWKISNGELFYPTFNYEVITDRSIRELRAAWSQLVVKSRVLRTVFVVPETYALPLQVVLKAAPCSLYENEERVSRSQQPMVQLHVRGQKRGYSLGLTIHHALYDAISLPLLIQNLRAILESSPSATENVDFADFVALSLLPEVQSARKDFWMQYLQEIQPLRLRQPGTGSARKIEIYDPCVLTSYFQLVKYARNAQVTVQALLFAIYAKTYTTVASTSNRDVVFGIYIANRSHLPDLETLAAPTLNLLPLLVRSPRERSVIEGAQSIDSDLRKITDIVNSHVSLADILEWTGVKVDSFVNFLKLPDEWGEIQQGNTKITPVNKWEGKVSQVRDTFIATPKKTFEVPKEMRGFEPGSAYQHAVDMEFATSTDGKLSMGLFCREDLLTLEEAEGIVSAIRKELQNMAV